MKPFFLMLSYCAMLALPALPVTAADNISVLNAKLAENYLIPRYQALASSAASTDDSLQRLCEAPDEQRLADARRAFHNIADAWTAIEGVTLGPISENFRAERFNHWPGRRNAVGKALAKALARGKAETLQPSQFAKTSVALQGLATLERLLFAGPETLNQLRAPAAGGVARCALLTAIAANLRSISAALAAEWQNDALLTALSDNDGHPKYFTSAENAGQILLTDLLTIAHKVAYLNIGRALGANADLARPKLAEQWRSGRAARSIIVSLQSAFEMYESGFSDLVAAASPGDDSRLRQLFGAALYAARQLPPDFAGGVDAEQERSRFEQALAAVTVLRNRLREDVPRGVELHVGFTSFDGD